MEFREELYTHFNL